ncbi:MAG: hypothetical protein ACFB00_10100 [Parvularculaceae bacterium]
MSAVSAARRSTAADLIDRAPSTATDTVQGLIETVDDAAGGAVATAKDALTDGVGDVLDGALGDPLVDPLGDPLGGRSGPLIEADALLGLGDATGVEGDTPDDGEGGLLDAEVVALVDPFGRNGDAQGGDEPDTDQAAADPLIEVDAVGVLGDQVAGHADDESDGEGRLVDVDVAAGALGGDASAPTSDDHGDAVIDADVDAAVLQSDGPRIDVDVTIGDVATQEPDEGALADVDVTVDLNGDAPLASVDVDIDLGLSDDTSTDVVNELHAAIENAVATIADKTGDGAPTNDADDQALDLIGDVAEALGDHADGDMGGHADLPDPVAGVTEGLAAIDDGLSALDGAALGLFG